MSIARVETFLRSQPFMREIWLAEDEALQQIFNKVNDSEFNQSIEAMAGRFFKSFKKKKKLQFLISWEKEADYKELSLRNARRVFWSARIDLQEELGSQKEALWQQALERMGAWDQVMQEYGPDSKKGKLFSTVPNKPYFNE